MNSFNYHRFLNEKFFIIALVVLNFIVKIVLINANSISLDEPFSIYHAQFRISTIVSELIKGNNPPLYEILLHFWIQIFGISAVSVRFLSLVFSSLAVIFIFKAGQKFFNINIALTASLLFTFADYEIYFAHEARVYALFLLLTSISMYSFFNLAKKSDNLKHAIVLVIANILIIYSHFFGVFVLFVQFLSCIAIKDLRKNLLKRYLFLMTIVAVAYTPYLMIFFERFLNSSIHGTWVKPSTFTDIYVMLWNYSNQPITTVILISLLFSALLKYIIYYKKETISLYSKIVLIWFLFPFLFMFTVSSKYLPWQIPMFLDRYTIFISISYYLLCAIAINYLFSQYKVKILAATLVVLVMVATCRFDIYNKRPVKNMLTKYNELKTPESVTYICPPWFNLNFTYYYNIDYFKLTNERVIKELDSLLATNKIYTIYNANEMDTTALKNAKRIIFIDGAADFSFSGNNILNTLSAKFTNQEFYDFKTFHIYCYSR